jgi:predicted GNAT family N-acyltransferase
MGLIRAFGYADTMYPLALLLRHEVLRVPLGLRFTEVDVKRDVADIHIGYTVEDEILGCLTLTDLGDGRYKMRQVAVHPSHQRKSIGRAMTLWAHEYARELGGTYICCHARLVAVPFYLSLGYVQMGEGFTEVGIPHVYMECGLTR